MLSCKVSLRLCMLRLLSIVHLLNAALFEREVRGSWFAIPVTWRKAPHAVGYLLRNFVSVTSIILIVLLCFCSSFLVRCLKCFSDVLFFYVNSSYPVPVRSRIMFWKFIAISSYLLVSVTAQFAGIDISQVPTCAVSGSPSRRMASI